MTRLAEQSRNGLRGARRKRVEDWLDALAAQGCAAMGYRLTGDDPLPSLCCVHLRGKDRAIVAFQSELAVVLLVGPHNEQDAAVNVYNVLYDLLGHSTVPLGERTKPSCCDEESRPPHLPEDVIDDLFRRSKYLLRT